MLQYHTFSTVLVCCVLVVSSAATYVLWYNLFSSAINSNQHRCVKLMSCWFYNRKGSFSNKDKKECNLLWKKWATLCVNNGSKVNERRVHESYFWHQIWIVHIPIYTNAALATIWQCNLWKPEWRFSFDKFNFLWTFSHDTMENDIFPSNLWQK